MASTTSTVIVPALTGTEVTSKDNIASSQTITIAVSTAASTIDGSTLIVRATNVSTTASVGFSIGVGTEGSSLGIGAATGTIATDTTVIIGGQGLDTSRFQTSAGTIVITFTGTGPTSIESYQKPRASE